MYSTQEQKDAYVEKLFSDVTLFEWDVLHVSTNTDRVEVMEIICEELVHDTLKHELNFLYVNDVEKINFSNIKGFIFKQMINEWLTFCDDVLMYPKESAIAVVKQGDRIKFIYSIVNSYFEKYQRFIYSEIINTFFTLFERLPVTKNRQIQIERILQSKLNYSKDPQRIYKFNQLFSRIKIAQDKKSKELHRLNSNLKKLKSQLCENEEKIDINEDNEILLDIEDCEYDIEELEQARIYEFDDAIANVRENLITGMINLNHTNVNS